MFREVALAVLTTVLTTLPVDAQEQDHTEIWPHQVSRHAARPCVAGGPTQKDAAIGAQLNTALNNKMRGHMNAYNTSCARAVVRAVRDCGFDERAAAIAVATVIVETSIANLDGGDRDSVGLNQQRASWGSFAQRTDPAWATGALLDTITRFYPNGSWNCAPVNEKILDFLFWP